MKKTIRIKTKQKKVRVIWERKPHTKIKTSAKSYTRKKRVDFDLDL